MTEEIIGKVYHAVNVPFGFPPTKQEFTDWLDIEVGNLMRAVVDDGFLHVSSSGDEVVFLAGGEDWGLEGEYISRKPLADFLYYYCDTHLSGDEERIRHPDDRANVARYRDVLVEIATKITEVLRKSEEEYAP